MTTRKRQDINEAMLSNIYDLLRLNALPDSHTDDWAILTRKIGEQAKRELKQFIKSKTIAVSGNTLDIGKHFTIKLL